MKPMLPALAPLLLLPLLSCDSQIVAAEHVRDATATDLVTVRGSARRYTSWCAGVAPRPEDEEAMRKGEPIRDPLFVHAGERYEGGEPIARISPAADGSFEVALPPGRYCVVLEAHELPSAPIPKEADEACVKSVRARCDSEWIVDAAKATLASGGPIEIAHHTGCSWNRPCYPEGPLPP